MMGWECTLRLSRSHPCRVARRSSGGPEAREGKPRVERMLDAVHLSHTFDGAFTLSAGRHDATNMLARGGRSTVVQDRVFVSLAVDRYLVTVVRLPEDAMWPDLLRRQVTKRLDLDVHAELPTMRDAFGHDSTGAPFGGCDLEKELAPVLDVHVVNVQVEWLCGAA